MLDPRTVSTAYVRALLGTVESAGVSPQQMLQGVPVDAKQLAQANGRVGVGVSRLIWDRALLLTGDTLLGLKVAQSMKPTTFRVLGLATMSCATLEHAVGVMLRYQRLVSESGTLAAQAWTDGNVALVHTEQTLRVRILPQQVEAVIAGMFCQARWLAGRDLVPLAVSFRHSALGDLQTYRHCFGMEPQFGADANRLVLSLSDLRAPLPSADAELCRLHCEMADQQLAGLPQVGYVSSFAVQWLANQASGSVRMEDLAATLGMSPRSLQRALKAEGKSWTTMVDEARRVSLESLLQQGMSIEDAAQRMGYHDASSVSRAARRWFGVTPGQWREGAH